MNNLANFFSPKSMAIVGASPKPEKLGNVLIENIRRGGWRGKMYLVNPKYTRLKTNKYYASLGEIKKPIDLALIAIPAPLVNQVIEEGATAAPPLKNFVVISAGFKESGAEGKKLEENLASLAKKYNLNILGPNCLGFANPQEKLNATFTEIALKKGKIAIVSQSGALAVALLDWADSKKIGFSKIISIGNKTVLGENQILNFLASDENTKAIALYLEDIQNGPQFIHTLAKITPRKPVIILKAGKTPTGQKAVSSHTGSLAQDEEIIEAVFEKLNVIPADNIEEFQDIIYYLNSNPLPTKKEVIILTNAGGPGVMASDFVGKSKNINLLKFSSTFKKEIQKNLPASASLENPIDIIGDAPPERYEKTLENIAKFYPNNPLLVILTPQNQTQPEKVAQILAKFKNKLSHFSACFMGGEKIAQAKASLEKNNIPNFENPEKILAVIEKLVKYNQSSAAPRKEAIARLTSLQPARQNDFVEVDSCPEASRFRNARSDIVKALAERRKMLFWKEVEKLFKKYDLKLTPSISFENINELKNKKIPFPCVLKTNDPNIPHRLEKNAVVLNLQNEKELKIAFKKMKKSTRARYFLLQPVVESGLELIVGIKRDPTFGPIALCGWGGSFTEIFKDKVILIPPLSQSEILRKLSQLAIFPILKGFRGKRGYDLPRIASLISTFTQIALENPEIAEIDINPLVVYNNKKEGQILDAKIFLA